MNLTSSTSERRLPSNWIQKIFATMQGHYGTRFLNMWKTGQVLPDGTDAGITNAMHHWDKKLAGWASSPETIRKVLDNFLNFVNYCAFHSFQKTNWQSEGNCQKKKLQRTKQD